MSLGRAGVARVPERGIVDINPHSKEWRLNQGVWVQEGHAPDAYGEPAALITERFSGQHRVGDFYRLPCRGVVAFSCEIKPQVGRPWFVITANGNIALRSTFRLRPNLDPEITLQPALRFCRTTASRGEFGYFRLRVQVPDFDGLGFFLVATLNLLGDPDYDGNLNLGYHLARVRMRYLCL